MRQIKVREKELLYLILAYLEERGLCASLIALELESGLSGDSTLSDNLLYLRRLVLSGRWTDAISFLQPLQLHPRETLRIQERRAQYIVEKQRLLELLAGGVESEDIALDYKQNEPSTEKALRQCILRLEQVCDDQAEFSRLCLLLTLPDFRQHPSYRRWNLYQSRLECFKRLRHIISDTDVDNSAGCINGDAPLVDSCCLLQLVAQGALYEKLYSDFECRSTGEFTKTHPAAASSHLDLLTSRQVMSKCGPLGSRFELERDIHAWLWSLPKKAFIGHRADTASARVQINATPFSSPQSSPLPSRPQSCLERPYQSSEERVENELMRSWHGNLARGSLKHALLARGEAERDEEHDQLPERSLSPEGEAGLELEDNMIMRSTTPQEQRSLWHSSLGKTHEKVCAKTHTCGDMTSIHGSDENEDFHREYGLASVCGKPGSNLLEALPEAQPVSILYPPNEARGIMEIGEHQDVEVSDRDHILQQLESAAVFTSSARMKDFHVGELDSSPLEENTSHLRTSTPQPLKRLHSSQIESKDMQSMLVSPSATVSRDLADAIAEVKHQAVTGGLHSACATHSSRSGAVHDHLVAENANDLVAQRKDGAQLKAEQFASKLPVLRQNANRLNQVTEITEGTAATAGEGLHDHLINGCELSLAVQEAPAYRLLTKVEDAKPIRSVAFNPSGSLYAVGSNSGILRICHCPSRSSLRSMQADVVFKRAHHHRGSIYCLAWSGDGCLLVSGSNDKLVRVVRLNTDSCVLNGPVTDYTHHKGTVRDTVFCGDYLLASGGADGSLYLTDVNKEQLAYHLVNDSRSSQLLSLAAVPQQPLVWSVSSDSLVSLWDLRLSKSAAMLQLPVDIQSGSRLQGSALSTDGELVVVGCEGGHCLVMESRSQRWLQQLMPHLQDCRSVHVTDSHPALLSASFDGTVALALRHRYPQNHNQIFEKPVAVAQHLKKVIQVRWHPSSNIFATTSTDHTACLWQPCTPVPT